MERVSTAEQLQGYGLEVQDEACLVYVNGKGWQLHDVYKDEGESGSLTSRPGFDRLMADARAGLVDVVVVHKWDRVGRTGRAFWRWIWELEDLGVEIVSVSQQIDTTTTQGKLMLQQYAAFAEFEYNLIRERTQAGLQAKAARGGWPGGEPPYGYRIEGKGKKGSYLVLDEREVSILRRLWKMAVEEGLNTREMAARLSAEQLFTRSGKPWSHSNVRGKLVSDSTLKAITTFRNPDRAHAGHGAEIKEGRHGQARCNRDHPSYSDLYARGGREPGAGAGSARPWQAQVEAARLPAVEAAGQRAHRLRPASRRDEADRPSGSVVPLYRQGAEVPGRPDVLVRDGRRRSGRARGVGRGGTAAGGPTAAGGDGG
ncbi:recombinase family protein [Streptomyces sp. NPDC055722]